MRPGEVDGEALDVVDRQHALEQPVALLGHRHADEHAVEPGPPGAGGEVVRACTARGGRRRGPSGCRCRRPSRGCARGPRPRAGSAGGPARGRRGRARRRRSGAGPARSMSWATTPSTGFVWRSERSARRTRRSVGRSSSGSGSNSSSSTTSPAPKVAWISGANASMSGHMTITSRGCSVSSSSSRWRIASRRTSTWRARPWQEWIWMLRSSGRARAARAAGSGAGRRAVGAHVGLDAGEQRVAAGVDGVVVGDVVVRPEHELHLARVLPPGGEQAVVGERGGGVVGAADDRRGACRSCPTAPARGGGGRRGPRARRRARAGPRGGRPAGASGRTARGARGGRRATASARSCSHAGSSRSAGLGVASRSRSRRHSSACQRARPRPRAQPHTIAGRCSA